MDYVFMMDSDSDLPYDLKVKYDIPVVYMPYALDGKEYFDDLGQTLDHKSYFERMRAGAVPVTSALNEETYMEYFEPILREKDLLFVAFSSKMSSTIQAVYAARNRLLEMYPQRKFIVVDTLSISTPVALLALKAHEMYRAGAPIEEVADWLEKNKLRAQGWFTVDDLKYLKRGGRITPAAAALGTLLRLKPVLQIQGEKLDAYAKSRTKKAAKQLMQDAVRKDCIERFQAAEDFSNIDFCFSYSGTDRTEIEEWMQEMQQVYPNHRFLCDPLSLSISCHIGPGAIAMTASRRMDIL